MFWLLDCAVFRGKAFRSFYCCFSLLHSVKVQLICKYWSIPLKGVCFSGAIRNQYTNWLLRSMHFKMFDSLGDCFVNSSQFSQRKYLLFVLEIKYTLFKNRLQNVM